MTVLATRFNYTKLSDGYALASCTCLTQLSCVLMHDPQKVWRCNSCYAPRLHPRPDDIKEPTTDVYPPPYCEPPALNE